MDFQRLCLVVSIDEVAHPTLLCWTTRRKVEEARFCLKEFFEGPCRGFGRRKWERWGGYTCRLMRDHWSCDSLLLFSSREVKKEKSDERKRRQKKKKKDWSSVFDLLASYIPFTPGLFCKDSSTSLVGRKGRTQTCKVRA